MAIRTGIQVKSCTLPYKMSAREMRKDIYSPSRWSALSRSTERRMPLLSGAELRFAHAVFRNLYSQESFEVIPQLYRSCLLDDNDKIARYILCLSGALNTEFFSFAVLLHTLWEEGVRFEITWDMDLPLFLFFMKEMREQLYIEGEWPLNCVPFLSGVRFSIEPPREEHCTIRFTE